MKRVLLLFVVLVAVAGLGQARQCVVVDATDCGPVVGATIIGRSGIIKGQTDKKGRIDIGEAEFPVDIRCIGYRPAVASGLEDTIRLAAATYQLGEVVVSPANRPVKRVVCFAREYCSGTSGIDTLQYYCEYMSEAFIADGKVKGYRKSDAKPAIRSTKKYVRSVSGGVDSIFTPKSDDDMVLLSWFELLASLPEEKLELTEAIRNGATVDTMPANMAPTPYIEKRMDNSRPPSTD